MVPYRFDERVGRHLALLVPRRRNTLASYELEALDELLATGPQVLVDAPADVGSLVRHLLTTCSLELDDGSVVELFGVVDFIAANAQPSAHGVAGALLVGSDVLVDVEGAIDADRLGAVYVQCAKNGTSDAELVHVAESIDALLGAAVHCLDEAPERAMPSSAPPRSSFIRELVLPDVARRRRAR